MAAEPRAPGPAQPRLEPVLEPHSDLEVSEQDETRAPARPVRALAPAQRAEEQPPARAPAPGPRRPTVYPARDLRHRRPTAAR